MNWPVGRLVPSGRRSPKNADHSLDANRDRTDTGPKGRSSLPRTVNGRQVAQGLAAAKSRDGFCGRVQAVPVYAGDSRARSSFSVSRHSMPRAHSSRRPAALSRRPDNKAQVKSIPAVRPGRPATSSKRANTRAAAAKRDPRQPLVPTRIRLLASMATRLPPVPSASHRSSNSPDFGSGAQG